ncbi:MAG: RluA family pseudouridine synthase [Candidatus Saccharibacteria bacterium]
MKKFEFTVDDRQSKGRIDSILANKFPDFSRAMWSEIIKANHVTIDGKNTKPSEKVSEGSVISGLFPEIHNVSLIKPNSDIQVLYKDKDVIVINKPAGIVVHPSGKHNQASVAGAFEAEVEDDDLLRPGIVHRLDKDTSGVMILSRSLKSKHYLQNQFKTRKVDKTYVALVWGSLDKPMARIEFPITRSKKNPEKMMVSTSGKMAISEYRVIKEYKDYSLIEIKLLTGRTHQIRVHFSHLGNPIVGDVMYGNKNSQKGLNRQFLHSSKLGITLPSGQYKVFQADLPEDLDNFIKSI